MVCSLTGQVPAELPQTLTAQEQCVCVCVCGGLGVLVHEFDRDNENKKKKKTRGDGEGYIRTSVHILPHRQAEGSSFYCKCG